MLIDIARSANAGLVYRAKDGTVIQVAVYDNAAVRILMSRGEEVIQDKTVQSTDAT